MGTPRPLSEATSPGVEMMLEMKDTLNNLSFSPTLQERFVTDKLSMEQAHLYPAHSLYSPDFVW